MKEKIIYIDKSVIFLKIGKFQTVVRVPPVVRENLQGGSRIDILSVFFHKKYIHSCSFYLSGFVNKFLNFCGAYFPCCFLKVAIKISHSHFVHVAFVSILVFLTFDRMIFGTLTFPGTRWYVMSVRDTQMVRDQKKFENHCFKGTIFRYIFYHSIFGPQRGRRHTRTELFLHLYLFSNWLSQLAGPLQKSLVSPAYNVQNFDMVTPRPLDPSKTKMLSYLAMRMASLEDDETI